MRVGVIGAGAIGGLYGGLLARAGHEVSFLARGAHLRAIQERGLEIRSGQFGTFVVHCPASDNPADLGQSDLVLFAVKTFDLQPAAEAARQLLSPTATLLTFQNGVDAPDRLAEIVGPEHVLIGTTGLETTILEPGIIAHMGPGHFVSVAALNGPPTPTVERVVETLRAAEINASVAEDGHRALWEKALILFPMATVTSVMRAPIGPIRDLPEAYQLIMTVLEEVTAVARAYGYDLPEGRERAQVIIDSWPPTGKASMARDFERGNRVELEALTGTLVRLGEAKGVDVSASRTCYAILKLRQQVETGSEFRVGVAASGR